jgi:WD40 repeat protein
MPQLLGTTTDRILCAALERGAGTRLALGLSNADVVFLNTETSAFTPVTLQGHEDAVRSLAWFKHTGILITGDDSGYLNVWRSPHVDPDCIKAHRAVVRGIACAPTGSLDKFATCSDDYTTGIRDFETLVEEMVIRGHGWDVKTVDWHPSEPVIATGGKDNIVYIWDVRTGNEVGKLQGHRNTVNCVRFSPSGGLLLSGSRDRTVKTWDWRTGREVSSYPVGCEATAVVWNFGDDTGFVVASLRRPETGELFHSNECKGDIQYWTTDRNDAAVENHPDAHAAEITGLVRRGEGVVLSVSCDKTVLLWE